jgi:RNA polymerase sigma-70 factor (ECF subfamily)
MDADPSPVPSLADLSDEELVERCRVDSPDRIDGFHELLNRYEGLVYHTCLRMIGQVQEAEETCQDVFLRLYQKIDQFEGRSQFKTWLFRVVHNLCLTRRRNLAIRRERTTEIEAEATRDEASRQQDAESDGSQEISESVRKAISRMKPDDQEVIMLRFVSEMSIEEIADLLGTGLSATKMRLYRAMDRFKAIYLNSSEDGHALPNPSSPSQPNSKDD